MKRLFIALIVVLLTAGMVYAVTPGYRLNPGTGDILGQGDYQDDAHKIFRMVRYVQPGTHAGAQNLTQDSICIWNLSSDDGVTVTTTTTSFDSAVAGIVVQTAITQETEGNTAAQDRGLRNWTWLQTYGLSEVTVTSAAVTAGDALGTGHIAGQASSFVPSTGTSGLNGNAGFFYDTIAITAGGSTDNECFIRCD